MIKVIFLNSGAKTMQESHEYFRIQELDMKMIRLMRVKKERQKEIDQIESCAKNSTTS